MEIKPKFTAKDFLDLKYNVAALTESQTVLGKFPELKKYPEFSEKTPGFTHIKISVDKMFRYVLLMYTDNIIHRLIPEFAHRKREAALLAGFPVDDNGKFSGMVEKMLYCEYESVNDVAVRVMFMNKNSDFQLLVLYNDILLNQMREMYKMGKDKKDAKGEKLKEMLQNIQTLKGHIEELKRTLTNGDNNTNLLDKLYSWVEGINLGIRPEEIALGRKQGKLNEIIKER